MIGKKFGKWTVVSERPERRNGNVTFECICECGVVRDRRGSHLTSESATECKNPCSNPDIVGKRFGNRCIIEKVYKKKASGGNRVYLWYKVLCDKGHISLIGSSYLKNILSTTCKDCTLQEGTPVNKHETQAREYIGKIFGSRTVIDVVRKIVGDDGQWWFVCRCENNHIKNIPQRKLKNGSSDTCHKCFIADYKKNSSKIKDTYRIWKTMRQRCLNENSQSYVNYGARGIYICETWGDFNVFYKDMGDRPSQDMSLDRVDNDGPYSKENCRWATKKQQCENRRVQKRVSERVGAKINDWTVLEFIQGSKGEFRMYVCECICGMEETLIWHQVEYGLKKSCRICRDQDVDKLYDFKLFHKNNKILKIKA